MTDVSGDRMKILGTLQSISACAVSSCYRSVSLPNQFSAPAPMCDGYAIKNSESSLAQLSQ